MIIGREMRVILNYLLICKGWQIFIGIYSLKVKYMIRSYSFIIQRISFYYVMYVRSHHEYI